MIITVFSLREKGSNKRQKFITHGKFDDFKHFWKVFNDDWYDKRTFKLVQDLSIPGEDPVVPTIQPLELE